MLDRLRLIQAVDSYAAGPAPGWGFTTRQEDRWDATLAVQIGRNNQDPSDEVSEALTH
jgi:hypothetical protein